VEPEMGVTVEFNKAKIDSAGSGKEISAELETVKECGGER